MEFNFPAEKAPSVRERMKGGFLLSSYCHCLISYHFLSGSKVKITLVNFETTSHIISAKKIAAKTEVSMFLISWNFPTTMNVRGIAITALNIISTNASRIPAVTLRTVSI